MADKGDSNRIPLGKFVIDREDDDRNRAVVVHHETEVAEDFVIPQMNTTVSEYNPKYPASSPVTTVVFRSDLRAHIDGWEFMEPRELWYAVEHNNVRHYAYPEARLEAREFALSPLQTTDNGLLHSSMLLVTNAGSQLVFAEDYQRAGHQHGSIREVCFAMDDDWDIRVDNVVAVEYYYENASVDGLPTMLCDVEALSIQFEEPDWEAMLSQ